MTGPPPAPPTSGRGAFPILFIDAEALVIDKPAGLPVDRPKDGSPSLADMVDDLRFGFARPPGLVHRLDRDTSGCLILARNHGAHRRFSASFSAGEVRKTYLAVVEGIPEAESGSIELALSKISSAEAGWRMIPARKGKPAVTHWTRLRVEGGRALIRFEPQTGRTHQLRVHAASGLGMPIVGDPTYGLASARHGGRPMLLHASRIVMPRHNKAAVDVESPLPERFGSFARGEG